MLKSPKHIFIVHAQEINAVILDYILSKDRIYRFLSFNTEEECLDNLHLRPDIIILDYSLLNSKSETVHKIKKNNSNASVVVINDNDDEKLKLALQNAGTDNYIIKNGHGEVQIMKKIDELLDEVGQLQY